MKKKIICISLIALALCGCGKVSKLKNGEDSVVSFKNIDGISVDTLYDSLKDRYALSVLIDMIDKEILFKEYKDKIKDAEDYAKEQVELLQKNYESEEKLIEAIKNYYGYSNLKEFKEYIELNYFRDLATKDYAKKQVTDENIQEYYDNEIVGDIEASHILITSDVKDDAKEEEKTAAEEKAKKQAEEIIEKLNNGEDFSKLAEKYSKDDSNKNNGGALGKFNKGDMEKAFEDAAYSLKVNEYTKEPVKTSYGYHIIMKTKEYDKKELKEVKDTIIEKVSDNLINSDKTISISALKELRKEKGMKIEDSELQSSYNTYINSMYNYYKTSTTSTN